MSTPAANPQHEPTMEEILASIRKIISEDQPEPAKPAAQPVPLRAVEPAPAPIPEPAVVAPAPAAEMDVLELTEEVPEEQPAAPEAAAPADNDIAFETVEPSPKSADIDTDDLISDSTRSLVSRAFASMDKGPMDFTPMPGASIESIFVQAVQGAFQPTLKDWVDSHHSEIMDTMKPLIRAWMDEHLPPLIEAAVNKEIGRAASERGRKR